MMIRTQNPDGTWTERTDEEFIKEFGEEEWRWINTPLIPRSEMTEGEKYLADKMQDEAETSAALRSRGIESLDDLPHESDYNLISSDDVESECDVEGADEDSRAGHPALVAGRRDET